MNCPITQLPSVATTDSALPGILAKTGTGVVDAVVQRVRVAPALIAPEITPAAPIIVVVKKPHTNPAKVAVTLKAKGRVRSNCTLTRTMTATSGSIRLLRPDGKELSFTPITGSTTESEHVFSAGEINAQVKLFAVSDSPCSNLDDYRLKLSLSPGPTAGPPFEANVVAVSLTLDISPPRSAPGAILTPLPQPPATPPPPGTGTDKWFGGLVLNAQDPGNNQQRAQLLATQVIPTAFTDDLLLQQVKVSGNDVKGPDDKVLIFDSEIPGSKRIPPVPETAIKNPVEFNAAATANPGKAFFVEGGKTASTALRDTGFQLGLKVGEKDGDRVAITVAVAPVLAVDSPFVVVKKPHTNPARRVITLSTSVASTGSGKLTKSGTGPIHIFKSAAGKDEIKFDDTDNVFKGSDLAGNGVKVFAESTAVSGNIDDFELTLTLTSGALPVGKPASVKLTAVELKLDIAASPTSPNVVPPLLSETEKANPGRILIAQDAAFRHERARIVVNRPNPNVTVTLRLATITGSVQSFKIATPGPGQPVTGDPLLIPSLILPPTGTEFFVEGKTPTSAAFLDSGYQLGIDGLENDGDHVVITVLPDPSLPGPFPVGEHEYTRAAPLSLAARDETLYELTLKDPFFGAVPAVQHTDAFSANIHALVRYPAKVAGVDKDVSGVLPKYPLVVIAHGNHNVLDAAGNPVESFKGLAYLAAHLASYGYIAISIDLDVVNTSALGDIFPGIEQRGLVILEHIDFWKTTLDASDARFKGKVDLTKIGLIGHSRGGEAVVSAQKSNVADGRGFAIKAVTSISQTDFLGINHTTTPYLVIYGSADGDVSLGWPFRMYDRASPFKALLFVYGAIHNSFSTSPDWLANLDPDPPEPRKISDPDHLSIAKGYCLGFLQLIVRGVNDHMSLFKNNVRPSAVSAGVEIFQQVQDTTRLVVDNYEQGAFNPANPPGPQLASRASTNTLLQTVDQTALKIPAKLTKALTEASLRHRELQVTFDKKQFDKNDYFWNDTFGAMLAWEQVGANYTQPVDIRDVSSFQVLSFRVTQRLGSPRNPNPAGVTAGTSPDFSVELVDSAGEVASVRVGSVAVVPFPWKRIDNIRNSAGTVVDTTTQFSKSALTTIRIPLSEFKKATAALDLKTIKKVVFRFAQTAKGEIAIDDLEFSN